MSVAEWSAERGDPKPNSFDDWNKTQSPPSLNLGGLWLSMNVWMKAAAPEAELCDWIFSLTYVWQLSPDAVRADKSR